MINAKIVGLVADSKYYIAGAVFCSWVLMVFQILATHNVSVLLNEAKEKSVTTNRIIFTTIIVMACIAIRFLCDLAWNYFSYLASKEVKLKLREMIYNKLLRLGANYNEKVATSEIVQVTAEGVEQLETYFGRYLPQLFFSVLAPITLFIAFSFISLRTAVILLICVPLIPISIICISKYARKIVNKYWGTYLSLGDTFLENLQGLTTLKIYECDELKNTEMNEKAELFRKITMKVLFMQLSSIVVMDFIAYGGAGCGIISSLYEYKHGKVDFRGCFEMILLSAEFFLPLRALGSSFHVAMNGISASSKIFHLLNLPEEGEKQNSLNASKDDMTIKFENVNFSYADSEDGNNRQVLHNVSLTIQSHHLVSIVGESGCGKSTIAQLIAGINKHYSNGSITIGNKELSTIDELSLMENITTVNHNSYIFKGTVRSNLEIAKHNATDEEMYNVLQEANLLDFVKSQNGLDTVISEQGSNLSGGQRQRLAIARSLLVDSSVYIFDEATSNIDIESEEAIMNVVDKIAKTKTVLLISHRLVNVVNSDEIYVMDNGHVVEHGTHDELMKNINGTYANLYNSQYNLEHGI